MGDTVIEKDTAEEAEEVYLYIYRSPYRSTILQQYPFPEAQPTERCPVMDVTVGFVVGQANFRQDIMHKSCRWHG